MNYFDTYDKQVKTETLLKMHGIPVDNKEIMDQMEIYPITYNYPEYNRDTQTYVPKENQPHPRKGDPKNYDFDFKVVDLSKEEQDAIVKHLIQDAIVAIDKNTSDTILAGFDCKVNTDKGQETLHFSYDQFDQSNFTDSAVTAYAETGQVASNASPTTVYWNGYRDYDKDQKKGELVVLTLNAQTFLPIYNAALAHKSSNMAAGSQKRVEIAKKTTAAEIREQMKEWGISF